MRNIFLSIVLLLGSTNNIDAMESSDMIELPSKEVLEKVLKKKNALYLIEQSKVVLLAGTKTSLEKLTINIEGIIVDYNLFLSKHYRSQLNPECEKYFRTILYQTFLSKYPSAIAKLEEKDIYENAIRYKAGTIFFKKRDMLHKTNAHIFLDTIKTSQQIQQSEAAKQFQE